MITPSLYKNGILENISFMKLQFKILPIIFHCLLSNIPFQLIILIPIPQNFTLFYYLPLQKSIYPRLRDICKKQSFVLVPNSDLWTRRTKSFISWEFPSRLLEKPFPSLHNLPSTLFNYLFFPHT